METEPAFEMAFICGDPI